MDVLRSFGILLLAQLVGEALHRALHLPLPGPVLGMALLAAVLLLRRREPDAALVKTSNGLLRWLGLLFVPAGAGVVANLELLRAAWFPIAVALVVSTLLTITVTALVMQGLLRRGERVVMDVETPR
ncbi:putative effector of murein hydrolase LrgA [Terriglobus roseus DSM 18391]|uniref:Putative effector of murein hydrolase LrgA n=1 Tax=Terriglobus roseus (strain DSM 18391 / NRRL B-41598 / KBS 63) TaxID=926566 RepID=I3ZC63_TERRK|nr:CidA/LrgA family protein [Terriglobus roseus]AFL86831.1 putative effector of murein hydrolase LrgA [Terriglobus roseus DSM 18391]